MNLQFAERAEVKAVRRGDPAGNVPDPAPPDADPGDGDEASEGGTDDEEESSGSDEPEGASESDDADFSDEENNEEEDDDTPLPDDAFKDADGSPGQLFPDWDFTPAGVEKVLKRQLAHALRAREWTMARGGVRTQTLSEMAAASKAAASRKRARQEEKDGAGEEDGAEEGESAEPQKEAELPTAKRRATGAAASSSSATIKDPHDTLAEQAFAISNEPIDGATGKRFRVAVKEGHERLFGADSRDIATSALLDTYALLDEAICRNYYRLLEGQGTSIALATTDGSVPLFQKMAHVSLLRLRNMAERNRGDDLKLLSTSQQLRSPDFIYYRSGTLWVPEKVTLFLYEIGRPYKLFSKSSGTWTGTNVPTGRQAIYRLSFPESGGAGFGFSEGGLRVSGSGSGGGGEMRADRGTEVEYRWHLNEALAQVSSETFAAACGLCVEWRREQSHQEDDFRKVPTAFPGLTYWRKWIDGDAAGKLKKNYPDKTLPLPPMATAGGLNASKLAWITLCSRFGPLRKKKMKGPLSADRLRQAGLALSRKKKLREGAGGVMRKQLAAAGYDGDGSSATKFVEAIIGSDGGSIRFWNRFSRDLTLRGGKLNPASEEGKAALKLARKALRTSQEWCHLHGQGDGGKEQLENFVAGSEHANTEQLAIETAQRLFSYKGQPLIARVTAYLMPNEGFSRSRLLSSEVKLLADAGWDEEIIKGLGARKREARSAALDKLKLLEPGIVAYNKVIVPAGAGNAAAAKLLKARDDALAAQLPAGVQERIRTSADPRRFLAKLAADLTPMFKMPAPIAVAVRYKVYLKTASGEVKVIDHLIQMQRESFDLLEYRFLYWAVQVALARRIGSSAIAQVIGRMTNPDRRKKVIGPPQPSQSNGSSSSSSSASGFSGSAPSPGGVRNDTSDPMDVDRPAGTTPIAPSPGGGS